MADTRATNASTLSAAVDLVVGRLVVDAAAFSVTATSALTEGFAAAATVTVQLPTFTPLILPSASTVATAGSLLVQISRLSAASAGVMVTIGMVDCPTSTVTL